MYIINETYFQAPKREIPNLNEADSRSFVELELLIDEKCRLLLLNFLTFEQFSELNSYLLNGLFPAITTGIPQKWTDLVIGKGNWKGLIYSKGTAKSSLLSDYVYYHYLIENVSYMTGIGDTKASSKGAISVNPNQRAVSVWNEFVEQYHYLLHYLNDNNVLFPNENRNVFTVKNQLGL